ncbi:MAG TPA: hypothetical protein DHV59_00700 [Oxalobacteraceae bacterium]|nr:hypothetical protein [Oxalobacteraceae bacterium]
MSRCARCGAEFACGMVDVADASAASGATDAPCWCMQLPTLPATALHDDRNAIGTRQATACLCRACLLAALASPAQGNGNL